MDWLALPPQRLAPLLAGELRLGWSRLPPTSAGAEPEAEAEPWPEPWPETGHEAGAGAGAGVGVVTVHARASARRQAEGLGARPAHAGHVRHAVRLRSTPLVLFGALRMRRLVRLGLGHGLG